MNILEADAQFCQKHDLIDYSVFLIVVDIAREHRPTLAAGQAMLYDK